MRLTDHSHRPVQVLIYHRLTTFLIYVSKILSRKGLYSFLSGEFLTIEKGSRVLSVGSGGKINELLIAISLKNEFDVIQLDIDKNRNPDIVEDICEWREIEGFDVIVMAEVLEHLHSPKQGLRNVLLSLKEGGKLILTAPFVFPIHDIPFDYYRFTKYGLELILKDFEDVQVASRNSWSEAICVLLARTVRGSNKWMILVAPFFLIIAFSVYPLAWLIGKIIPDDFMTTGYNVVARKPIQIEV